MKSSYIKYPTMNSSTPVGSILLWFNQDTNDLETIAQLVKIKRERGEGYAVCLLELDYSERTSIKFIAGSSFKLDYPHAGWRVLA